VKIRVADAVQKLEQMGVLERTRADHTALIISHVREQVGQDLPPDLEDFYGERIARIGDFHAITPIWNDHVGWRPVAVQTTDLLPAKAIPIFSDGCGSLFGLDLSAGDRTPAVYFFDHEQDFRAPQWAAGSSLGSFLLLLADSDRAQREGWPPRWELGIDPDLDTCPRAPALWNAG
jgi:hypothetical protein